MIRMLSATLSVGTQFSRCIFIEQKEALNACLRVPL